MNPRLNTALSAEPDYRELPTEFPEEESPSIVGSATVPAEDRTLSALRTARLLWAQRRLLSKALLAGVLAGIVIALLIPSRYESTVQLMPPDNQSAGNLAMLASLASKSAGGMGMIAGDLLGVRSSGALFVGILRSRTVEDRIIERFQLKRVYGIRYDEDARRKLSENSGAAEDRKSGIITLTVSDPDRTRAQAMATAYVEELNRLVAELSTSAAHRERVFLEERLTGVKKDLDQASHDLGEFSSKNAAVDVKEQARAMLEAAATLQGELIAAESQRQALETIYTPNNVRVREADARVRELKKELDKLGGREDGTGTTTTTAPNAAADADPLYPSLRRLPLLGAQYADLFRKAKIQEAVFETLTQQFEIAKVQEAKETPSVKMLDDASLPEHRSFPPRMLITFVCGLLGLLAASVWVAGKQRWDEIDGGDRRKSFAVEVFSDVNAIMPWADPNGSRWQAAAHSVWLRLTKRERQAASTSSLDGRGEPEAGGASCGGQP